LLTHFFDKALGLNAHLSYITPINLTPLMGQKMGKYFFITLLLASLNVSLATLPASAAELTAEQLVNNAHADGGLIATASTCHFPKETINQLIYLQKKAALDLAKAHQLNFTAQNYDEYVVAGFQSTMQFLSQQDSASESFDSLCEGIAEKVSQKIGSPAQQ